MSTFPATRLRRLRRTAPLRSLVRETTLSLDDFVHPVFVAPATLPNPELPPLGRFSIRDVVSEVDELVSRGVSALILFGIPEEKDELASGAWGDDGIVQRALHELRPRYPELLLLTDVCLCEYTSHGHCGVVRGTNLVVAVRPQAIVSATVGDRIEWSNVCLREEDR